MGKPCTAWGKSMSWHPTRTPGSSLRRFRVGITWWSGSAAVLWFALAVWRTATLGSLQFAVLLFFGLQDFERARKPKPADDGGRDAGRDG